MSLTGNWKWCLYLVDFCVIPGITFKIRSALSVVVWLRRIAFFPSYPPLQKLRHFQFNPVTIKI